jgi:hypothetical protein
VFVRHNDGVDVAQRQSGTTEPAAQLFDVETVVDQYSGEEQTVARLDNQPVTTAA